MSEKVVHEVRVIETEDGFRIELKGDKEELRQMIFGGQRIHFPPFAQFARHMHEHPMREHEHHRPFWKDKDKRHGKRKHHFYDLGPWWEESDTPTENA
jgi:hypothetical protein